MDGLRFIWAQRGRSLVVAGGIDRIFRLNGTGRMQLETVLESQGHRVAISSSPGEASDGELDLPIIYA
jgi:hypothetical protein